MADSKTELQSFERYLTDAGYAPKTCETQLRTARRLLTWLEGEGLCLETVSYADLLAWLRGRKESISTRHKRLGAARQLLAFLKSEGRRPDNPARIIRLRPATSPGPRHVLTSAQMDAIYEAQPEASVFERRAKAMLGLLVYQGLTGTELIELQPADLDLQRGALDVPPTVRREPRRIPLEAAQIAPLMGYLETDRPQLMARRPAPSEKLFITRGPNLRAGEALPDINRALHKRHDFYVGLRQLRTSRIVIWTERVGLRRAQYYAGHQGVASTERYELAGGQELADALETYHPLS